MASDQGVVFTCMQLRVEQFVTQLQAGLQNAWQAYLVANRDAVALECCPRHLGVLPKQTHCDA